MSDAFLCQLLIDPPAPGAWNMAVDEALLEAAANEGLATLRFYQWSEPTLSLGYFQKYAERESHSESESLAVVRRLSGGGTLLHDRELTYSLCLPSEHRLAKTPAKIYALVHRALIDALAAQGVTANFFGNSNEADDVFLCFERRTADDLVCLDAEGGKSMKIVGSAQRRRRGAVLQHGSLLLEASAFAPELPGVFELSGKQIELPELITYWSNGLAENLSLRLERTTLDNSLKKTAEQFAAERFGNVRWTKRN